MNIFRYKTTMRTRFVNLRSLLLQWVSFVTLTLIGGTLGYVLFGPQSLFAQSGTPPKITNVQIVSANATSALITWETDIDADSEINYGLNKEYGIAREPNPNKKKHSVIIDNLEPSTLYHFRVGSSNVAGDQGLSGDYLLATHGTKLVKNEDNLTLEERTRVEKAIEQIDQLKTPDALKIVVQEIQQVAQKIIGPPTISGTPHIDDVGSDFAVISWASDQESSSQVSYATDKEYDANSSDPYKITQGSTDERVKAHQVRVEGLIPGTLYHFSVSSKSDYGLTGASRDSTFTTKALLPQVIGFRLLKVEADAATLTWRTSIPAAGSVEYTDIKTKEKKTAGSPVLAANHTVKIAGLRLGSRYTVVVIAENAVGDKSKSNTLTFTTIKDVAPPLISKVNNESTLYPTEDAKVQTIVSWTTDEKAYCQLYYREGLSQSIPPSGLGEEKEPRTSHVQVVVEFLPSTVYQFWVECRDPSGNKAKSDSFVLFTPDKEKSIIDLILANFEGAFGWVKNVGK